MVGRISRKIAHLNARTWECDDILHHVMYMAQLTLKREDNPGGSNLLKWTYENRELSLAGGKREWWRKTEGMKHEKERQPAPRSRECPELTASKKAGLQSYNHKELDPAYNLNELGRRIFPTDYRQEPS